MTLGPRFLPPITLDFSTFLKIFALDFDKFRNYALKRRISNPAKRLHNLH